MPDQTYNEEAWTFCGRRTGSGNAIRYVWLDAQGDELWYQKLKGTVIGGTYLVEVDRSNEKITVLGGTPPYDSETPLHERRDEWKLLERTDLALRERKSLEKKQADADTAFEDACAMLKELYRKMPSHVRRSAFLFLVQEEITR